MKAERMITILILLQYGETISTRSLANELEVSERTIHRDMESLSLAGIPVFSERGKTGGWRLVDDWKQKLSWLKEKEVLSLFIPTSEKVLSDLNIEISTTELKQKLLLTVPEYSRKSALNLWERVHIDMTTWRDSKENIKSLEVIQKAVMNDQKVSILYKKVDGEVKTNIIQPLGLVAKGSTWYVVALNDHDEYRNFKVSRILDSSFLDEYFNRPEDFILATYWEYSKKKFIQNLPEYHVKVKVSQKVIRRIMFTGHFVRTLDEIDEVKKGEWIQTDLSFPTEEEAINFIVGFGNQIKVISPENLISKLTDRANEVLNLYCS